MSIWIIHSSTRRHCARKNSISKLSGSTICKADINWRELEPTLLLVSHVFIPYHSQLNIARMLPISTVSTSFTVHIRDIMLAHTNYFRDIASTVYPVPFIRRRSAVPPPPRPVFHVCELCLWPRPRVVSKSILHLAPCFPTNTRARTIGCLMQPQCIFQNHSFVTRLQIEYITLQWMIFCIGFTDWSFQG